MSKPWMPLYVADYRKDTAHLSTAEHGAYLLLIMHYWSVGSLPDDDRQLARITSMSPAEWRRARPVVQAFFHDGWRHKRIDAELAHAEEVSSKRRAAAEQKHNKRDAIAPANAEQLDTHARATSPSQPQSQERGSLRSLPRKRGEPIAADWIPSEKNRADARAKGLSDVRIDAEGERFRDHSLAKGVLHKNVDAAWRNWVTSPITRAAPNGSAPRPGSKEDNRERTAQTLRQLDDYLDAHADDEDPGRQAREANAGLLPFTKPA